jgi:hypothetical protein
MPVNGVEIKEGQVWLDACGQKRTIVSNKGGSATFVWKGVLENGQWDTYTNNGTFYAYNSSYNDLVTLISEKEEKLMKFNPKPGDKIICNNGDEATCCTLEFLRTTISPSIRSYKPILGYFEDEGEWQDWYENGCTDSDSDYNIREVIRQVLKEEPLYSVSEVLEAVGEALNLHYPAGKEKAEEKILDYLQKKSDPEYLKYLELKAKYEGK